MKVRFGDLRRTAGPPAGGVEELLDERECPVVATAHTERPLETDELRNARHGHEDHLGCDSVRQRFARAARMDEIAASCMVRKRSA